MAWDVFYRRRHWLLIATLALAGCASLGMRAEAPPPVTQPIKIVCLPQVVYSPADQAAFADEVDALNRAGKTPQVLRFLGDYKAMRDANRACHAEP